MTIKRSGNGALAWYRERKTDLIEHVYPSKRSQIIFNKGGRPGGTAFQSESGRFGEYNFYPQTNFIGLVEMWGGGGGNHHGGGSTYGGGGGHARAYVQFEKDVPYTIWVGQGGTDEYGNNPTNHNTFEFKTAFGGGGSGSGGGGGLSGIFYNSWGGHNSQSRTFAPNNPPGQWNSLLIAGGGGGGGHHGNSHHGQGAGGGGLTGNNAHNANGGGQQFAGNNWGHGSQAGFAFHGGHAGQDTGNGGGGGGWHGGGGGTHHTSHYNGGGGGASHAANIATPNYKNYELRNKVRNFETESAPGAHGNNNPAPARESHPLRDGAGRAADNSTGQGHNGRVLITYLKGGLFDAN